jgi:multicomponent Na+:H+ antiporter subunit A
MGLSLAVLSGFAVAGVLPFLGMRGSVWWSRVLALFPLGLFAYFVTLIPEVRDGGAPSSRYAWVPEVGLDFALRVDGLSLMMALLVTGIGALVVLYASAYLSGKPRMGLFFGYLLAFMASMLGLVVAENIITLFVFWELTSITSFMLISFESEKEGARKGAVQALLVTGGGGLALLGGLILLGEVAGSYDLSVITESGDVIRDSGLYVAILVLVLFGAFTKSAQFPFHFWLPSAMAAPTPVSAYLHSATMVKAGIYLLARLHPALGDTDPWLWALMGFGGATIIVGAYVAVHQHDLKLILAYSTVSALGILVALLGIGTGAAVKAAVVFLFAHALYKAGLFMVAGIIDHEAKTRDIRELSGLGRAMPYTAAGLLVAAASMAGLAPVLAFIGKEAILEAVLDAEGILGGALVGVMAVSGALFVVVAGMLLRPMVGKVRRPLKVHEAPLAMTAGPLVLAVLSLGLGLFPLVANTAVLKAAASAVAIEPVTGNLYLWHGFNTALFMSIGSIGAGIALLAVRGTLRPVSGRALGAVDVVRPSLVYDAGLAALNRFARWQTRVLQNGYLRVYLTVVLATAVILVGGALLGDGGIQVNAGFTQVAFYEVAVVLLILAGALASVLSDSRLTAVAALGTVGFGVALIYGLFGAPDLAMTQFLIETLTVLLFVLVFYRLPRLVDRSTMTDRVRDAAVATAFGGLMTILVLAALNREIAPTISSYFAENSYSLALGRNVVNVILVDFRALDTLGEVVVLAVAALGVFALLRATRRLHS